MRIFIGSSTEQSGVMKQVSNCLKKHGHDPVPWNEAISLSKGVLIDQLVDTSHEVDGAIFIFAEDDESLVRGKKKLQPRDNVIFEFGLFMGALGAGSVIFLRVGQAEIATDLRGVIYIHIPKSDLTKEAQKIIRDWASKLAPVYVKGLGFDLADHLKRILAQGVPVENILGEEARKLIANNGSNRITALCSDKGKYGKRYYKMQFDWVKKEPQRCIQRVFVRSKGKSKQNVCGFSPGEIKGIKMHQDLKMKCVEIRWIFANSEWLEGPYSSSLGFAIFGESWIMHWGLESGTFHDATKGADYGVLELLKSRFSKLWDHARPFEDSLNRRIRERLKTLAGQKGKRIKKGQRP